ncbi:MAG TPA: SURF1 family protein [Longimicrobiaceae bacterium]
MGKVTARGLAAAAGVLLIAAVCVRLGFWQLHRLEERRARNAMLAAALAEPVLALEGQVLRAVAEAPERFRFRRVRVSGRFDPAAALLLRGRARRGSPGVHLVTPLLLAAGDTGILVDRGWLPAADAATADPRPYAISGPVSVVGLLHPLPPALEEDGALIRPLDGGEVATVQRLHAGVLGSNAPAALLPVYLQRIPGEAGEDSLPLAEPIPALDEGPHLGYAFQWFSFAAIAVIGFAVVALRGPRRR